MPDLDFKVPELVHIAPAHGSSNYLGQQLLAHTSWIQQTAYRVCRHAAASGVYMRHDKASCDSMRSACAQTETAVWLAHGNLTPGCKGPSIASQDLHNSVLCKHQP
eukprot:14382-Heterococcus_DN1.PRE.5